MRIPLKWLCLNKYWFDYQKNTEQSTATQFSVFCLHSHRPWPHSTRPVKKYRNTNTICNIDEIRKISFLIWNWLSYEPAFTCYDRLILKLSFWYRISYVWFVRFDLIGLKTMGNEYDCGFQYLFENSQAFNRWNGNDL